jgi:hypothetical protein
MRLADTTDFGVEIGGASVYSFVMSRDDDNRSPVTSRPDVPTNPADSPLFDAALAGALLTLGVSASRLRHLVDIMRDLAKNGTG